MANYPRSDYCIAAYYLSRLTGIPLATYMHDLWMENQSNKLDIKLAELYESKIMYHSKIVYAITEKAKDFYQNKYKINNIVILPHSIDTDFNINYKDEIKNDVAGEFLEENEKIKIVFVGAIYEMNLDTLQFVTRAIEGSNFNLLLCTTTPKISLHKMGLLNDNVMSTMTSRSDAWSIQKKSDIILVPLSFSAIKCEIETVFPTKVLEHLLAKTPILSVVPKYSFLYDDINQYNYSSMITELNTNQLFEEINILVKNTMLTDELINNALIYAKMRNAKDIIKIYTDSISLD